VHKHTQVLAPCAILSLLTFIPPRTLSPRLVAFMAAGAMIGNAGTDLVAVASSPLGLVRVGYVLVCVCVCLCACVCALQYVCMCKHACLSARYMCVLVRIYKCT